MNEKRDQETIKCIIAKIMQEIARSGEESWIQSEWRLALLDNWPH